MKEPRPKIEILPITVANQIAAGEVVERPAAVIKELMENSLDAGATRIEVEFQQGGKTYIGIEDNGYGMSLEEARMALQRHATSKLKKAEDLLALSTFGFRGEALPSIASVSEFSLSTKIDEAPEGWEILVNAGQILKEQPCGKPVGTRIEVRHLFHPVPARRKFLKSDNTEAAKIIELVRLYALAYPSIGFSLKEKSRLIFKAPANQSLRERFECIYTKGLAPDMLDLPVFEQEGISLYGLIGRPGLSRSSREELSTLVNKRPITSRLLNQSIIEAYRSFIPPGRYPIVFLFLEIHPASIDVNVHPTKQEVRFKDEAQIRRIVFSCLQKRLEEALERSSFRTTSVSPSRTGPFPLPAHSSLPKEGPCAPEPFSIHQNPKGSQFQDIEVPPYQPPAFSTQAATHSGSRSLQKESPLPPLPAKKIDKETAVAPKPLIDWRFLFHWESPYSLFSTPKGLVLVDKRRVYARIAYEKAYQEASCTKPSSQMLTHLHPLELSPSAQARLEDCLPFLEAQGFSFQKEREYYALKAIPSYFDPSKAITFIKDFLGKLHEEFCPPQENQEAYLRTLSTEYAQSLSLSPLNEAEPAMLALMQELFQTSQPHLCPQNRPSYIELSLSEIQQRFFS